MTPSVIIQIGNQHSLHATEAAYRDAYTAAGCIVLGVTQDECMTRGQTWLYDRATEAGAAMLVYSRTHSPSALTPDWTTLWRRLEGEGIKTVGTHLDVYWGLPEREGWIASGDPMFTVGTLFTADGGSDEKWKAIGVNHVWLPPGCDTRFIPEHAEAIPELSGKIVFVGSNGYHSEWPHRAQMIDFASRTWPDRFVMFGNGTTNGPVRGENLARIYASDCIVIGDFAFADERLNYWSDRVPETLGRGGNLVVTQTEGISMQYPSPIYWTAYDFDGLAEEVKLIDAEMYDTEMSRAFGREQVLRHDTYRHRAKTVLQHLGIGMGDENG